MPDFIQASAGIAGLLALAWMAGEARRAVPWRAAAAGLGIQIVLAILP